MNILAFIFVVMFFIFLFFGKVTVNRRRTSNVFVKAIISAIGAALVAIILGLPILGVVSLFR